ncbi:MAG: nucleotidyltransferase domain-containing protein [Candidatus Delongbacteria bacterium]|nr:nucleotidyltransferase domain-containing protein [Candidatus Delongbacteria bacterium]MCG2760266.1 nucleotidyltransferase domain-containing protein [Candidatus Delongbacteria bacterium]
MNILAEIFSSKVRSEFFRILFGLDLKEYHLREIQRLSGFAVATVRQEAQKLTQFELILKREDGNRTYYSANKNHPLYPVLHDLVLKTNGLVQVLERSLKSDLIESAFIFGSISAGEEKSESDVDIFVIGDISLRELSRLLKEPCSIIGREMNPYVVTIKEFIKRREENDHFITRVLGLPKIMIKGSEDDIERMGK